MRNYFYTCLHLLFCFCVLVSCNTTTSNSKEANKPAIVYKVKPKHLKSFVKNDTLSNLALLEFFYEKNEMKPFWFSPDRTSDLNLYKHFIQHIGNHGLNASDYDYDAIQEIIPHEVDSAFLFKDWDKRTLINNDIAISNSFIKLTYNLYKGVIDVPMSADSNWFHNPKDFNDDEFNTILDTLHGNGIVALIDHFNLNSSSNNKFRQELISLKKRYDNQGWPLVEYGESLKPNDVDQRIISVRERLLKQKFIDVNDSSLVYDGELEVAVKAFQKKFNLVNDGVIGKATIDAMNVPVSKRIESLVVSLERNRWLPLQYPNEYVVANIAGFNVRYYKGDTVFYASKSIVGRYKRQTPAFHDTMTYVEINPYWTIPPTILEEDVIPKVLKDSSYLKNKNIRVLTKAGKEISPDSIDWTSVNPKRVPYKLKKDPGPYNDLGRIKFMFPNRHMIYFHDTPSRYLFASNVTAFSSGCVRIQDPYDFANALFHGNERWGNDSIEVEINKGENKRIKLDHPVPVYIVYQTVWIDDDGDVIYGNDIYEKDSLIFSKLNYKLESIETDLGEIIKTDSTLIQ